MWLSLIGSFLILVNIIITSAEINVYKHVVGKPKALVGRINDVEAPFGGHLSTSETIWGLVVKANPFDACQPIQEPPFLPNETIAWFVLINGSESLDCGEYRKAANAENAQYAAAILFTSHPSEWAHGNKYIDPNVEIPILIIENADGINIRDHYIFNRSLDVLYMLQLLPNTQDYKYYIMLFSVVIGICFVIMMLFMLCLIVKCIQERRRNRRNRLSSRQIRQLPTSKFGKGDQADVCAICLENYNEGEKLRILPCSHAYHCRCIDPWLRDNKRNCPLCKRKIHFGDTSSSSDSDSELTSPAENTPLMGSPSNRGGANNWGTFASNSSDTEDQQPLLSHQNVAADITETSELEEGIIISGHSVNSSGSDDFVDCIDTLVVTHQQRAAVTSNRINV